MVGDSDLTEGTQNLLVVACMGSIVVCVIVLLSLVQKERNMFKVRLALAPSCILAINACK